MLDDVATFPHSILEGFQSSKKILKAKINSQWPLRKKVVGFLKSKIKVAGKYLLSEATNITIK